MALRQILKVKQAQPLFDFDEIVKNVLDFVTTAVHKAKADGGDDEKLQSMLNDARKGVQIGVDDAIDELKGSGLFNDEIKEGIDKSKEGILSGLNDLEAQLFNPQPISVNVSQGQYISLSNSAAYTFTTAEGDEVSINFADAFKAQSASSYQIDGDSEGFLSESSQTRELSFSMTVNGDLNEEEQKAINELMADLQNVSSTFFSGDLDEAFEQAQALNLGNEQLVAFSMDLRQTKVVAAIKSYTENTPIPEKSVSDKIAPFNSDLKDVFEKANELDLQNQLSGLLQWLNQDQEEIEKLVDYTKAMFENLNQLNEAGNDLTQLESPQS